MHFHKTGLIALLLIALGCGQSKMATVQYDENEMVTRQNLLDILRLIETNETDQTDYRLRIQMPHKNTEYRRLSIIPAEDHYQLMVLDPDTERLLSSYKLRRSYVKQDTIPPAILKKIVPKP